METEKCSVDNFIVAHMIFYCSILGANDDGFLVAMDGAISPHS